MGVLDLLWCLLDLVLFFADILLWPEEALKRHLRREEERPCEPRSIWEVCQRVFIVLTIIGLCLLLLWI